MTVGKNHPGGVAVQTSRQLRETGSTAIRHRRGDEESGIVVTVGMFIQNHKGIRGAGVVNVARFFCTVECGPDAIMTAIGSAIRLETKPLGTVPHRSIHGAGAHAAVPPLWALGSSKFIVPRTNEYF